MALIANRKSIMTLYSDSSDIHSHRVRIVLAEKGINFEVIFVDPANPPEDLLELNPYGTVPTLVDRDLVLYDSHVIMEYLDERFPHPPLMPVEPVARGRTRMTLCRVKKDWDVLVDVINTGSVDEASKAVKELTESLTVISPLFEQKPFFLSDELSLLDCSIAPILWRLPKYGADMASQPKAFRDYAKRLFDLESFQASLSEIERDMQ
jgi:RNA polymerase-associated protein